MKSKNEWIIVLCTILSCILVAAGIVAIIIFGSNNANDNNRHPHLLSAHQANEATCTAQGNIAYWSCEECGKYFSDAEGKNEISLSSTVINKIPHTESEWIIDDATCTEAGSKHTECKVCHVTLQGPTPIPATGHHFENYVCTNCGIDEFPAMIPHVEGGTIDGFNIYMFVDADVKTVALSDIVTCAKNSTWKLYEDSYGQIEIPTKVAASASGELSDGDNVFYIIVTSKDGHDTNNYTLTIYRSFEISVNYYDTDTHLKTEKVFTGYKYTAYIPEFAGYSFIGWKNGDEFFTSGVLWDNLNLYAEKVIITYTITYHLFGGTNHASNPDRYDIETDTITLQPATREGYTFLGWFLDGQFSTEITEITIGSHGHKHIYAKLAQGTEGLVFTQYGEAYTVTGYTGKNMSVVVPAEWNGLPVTAIGCGVFAGFNLESLTIPFTGAEMNGTTNTHFGYIFGANSYSSNSSFVPSSLKTVIITGGNTIGDNAFTNCSGIKSISIPESVTSISDSAFDGCKGLTEVYWNATDCTNGSWSQGVFAGCDALETVVIGENVHSIPYGIFTECTGPKTIYWNATDCISVERHAFYNCMVQKVVFGENVQSIPEDAFYRCPGLTSVVIGKNVTSIARSAFSDCYRLVEVWNYSSLDIQKGSSDFGKVVFYALSVYTTDEASKLVKTDDGYFFYEDGSGSYLVGYIGTETDLTLPPASPLGRNYAINKYAFCLTKLTSVEIPDSVTSIGERAFYGCIRLTSIVIPDSVTSIGDRAFHLCGRLISVVIGESVKSIGEMAFESCSKLTSIVIPDSVTTIGERAFRGCYGLTSVVIGKRVTSIGYAAFRGCSKLTSVVIPDSVTSIGEYAFENCSGLTSVVIGKRVTEIGNYAFIGCHRLIEVWNRSDLNIQKGSSDFGRVAFYALNVYTTGEESKLTETDDGYLFYEDDGGSYLVGYVGTEIDLTLPQTSPLGRNYTIHNFAFRNCYKLTSIVIPDSVTSIGEYAFSYCKMLTSIVIGKNVTVIGEGAFYNCTDLTAVYYKGDETQWNRIDMEYDNTYPSDVTVYFYSAEQPPVNDDMTGFDGNFWHYDEATGEIVIWEWE